jgi:hypothetical protein
MKCSDFGTFLKAFANVLAAAGAAVPRDQILAFATIFDVQPKSSISDLVKRISALPKTESAGGLRLADVNKLLTPLKGLLDNTAKAGVLTDLAQIEALLRDRPSMEITSIVSLMAQATAVPRTTKRRVPPALRSDLVAHYRERLEGALGDEEKFKTIYDDLRANTAMGKPEIIALAKEMTGSGARTEDAALKKIWSRQQSLTIFNAKRRASGGRSAA